MLCILFSVLLLHILCTIVLCHVTLELQSREHDLCPTYHIFRSSNIIHFVSNLGSHCYLLLIFLEPRSHEQSKKKIRTLPGSHFGIQVFFNRLFKGCYQLGGLFIVFSFPQLIGYKFTYKNLAIYLAFAYGKEKQNYQLTI